MSAEEDADKRYETLLRAYRKLEDRFSKVLAISDKYGAQTLKAIRTSSALSAGTVPAPRTGEAGFPEPGTEDALVGRLRARLESSDTDADPFLKDVASLLRRYEKLNGRMNKIVTISDSYQAQLRDVLMRMDLMAHTDALTGISNRRDMMDRLEIELARADRYGSVFSLAIFDIDDFKKVNDLYGHNVGDLVLKQVAAAFGDTLRRSDSCARWGGEEFLILFPETAAAEASLGAEKCRTAVAALSFESGEARFAVTVSGGVCSYASGGELGELLKGADQALYRAKAQGKNRVVSILLPGEPSSGID